MQPRQFLNFSNHLVQRMLYKTALLPRIKKIIVAINFELHRLDSPGLHRRRRNFPRFVESKHGDDVGALFNGVSNLMVDFSHNNSSYSTDGQVLSSTGAAGRVLVYRSDSTSPPSR